MTKWKIFTDNSDAWASILEDCKKAEKSIDLEQFIFSADEFGQTLLDVCAERANHGVKVRFLWDAAGSFTFWGTNIKNDLKTKGIELIFWRTLIPGYFKVPDYRSWFLRNHRRTLVIDEKIAYTGSICVRDSMKNWRDTNVRIEGPIVASMQNAFERMWHRAIKKRPLPLRFHNHNKEFMYVTNYPAPGRHHINKHIIKAIKNARQSAYITTPYFVPTHNIFQAIRDAGRRGLDIKIIIPEKTTHYPALDLGARSFFNSLLEAGVRIFLYAGNVIHGKSVVIDGNWATVGSLNLDNVSLLYNHEANIITTNEDFAKKLTAHFEKDLQESHEITLEEWRERFFIEKIPEILIRLVRKFL